MDEVTLVDHEDRVIGHMDKVEAHRGKAKLHRAISVFLFNNKGELLMQQRSESKIVGALQWANTCCGNVGPGETYEQCAKRRLKEELGIEEVNIAPVTKFEYQVQCNDEFGEHEIDTVFVGKYDGKVNQNKKEVKDTLWTHPEEVGEQILEKPKMYAPWFIHFVTGKNIFRQIEAVYVA